MTDSTTPQVPEEPAVPPVEPVAAPEVPAYTAPAEPVAPAYTPPAEPVAPAYVAPAAAAPAAPAYAPAAPAAGPKQALSLTSFILGLAAVVFSWALFFGFLVAIAAIVLGFMGRKREPGAPRWMSLVGIITGFVALAIAIIVLIVWIAALVYVASVGSIVNQYG